MSCIAISSECDKYLFIANSCGFYRLDKQGNSTQFTLPTAADVKPVKCDSDEDKYTSNDRESAAVSSSKQPRPPDPPVHVVFACLSRSGRWVAAVLSPVRLLCVWSTEHHLPAHCFSLARAGRCATFAADEQALLLADKSGDVYKCNLTECGRVEPLFGHLSMILDMCVPVSGDCVYTCDRDEKVRCTSYPNTWTIRGYFLAHTQFVSCVAVCRSGELLVTAGGDDKLCLWEAASSRLLCLVRLSDDPVISECDRDVGNAVMKLFFLETTAQSVVIVVRHRCRVVSGYLVARTAVSHSQSVETPHHYTMAPCQHVNLHAPVVSAAASGQLLFLLLNSPPSLLQFSLHETACDTAVIHQLAESSRARAVEHLAPFCCTDSSQIEMLYKQSYDNVSGYLVKKQARITKNSEKKCSSDDNSGAVDSSVSNDGALVENASDSPQKRVCAR